MELNQNTSKDTPSAQPIQPETRKLLNLNESKLKIVRILFLFLIIITGVVIITLNLKLKTQQKSTRMPTNTQSSSVNIKSNAQGLIATNKGLMIISSEGIPLNNTNNQPKFFLPPGMTLDYFQKFTDYYSTMVYTNKIELDNEGKIFFIGAKEIETALKQDTIYEWSVGSIQNPTPFFTNPDGKKIVAFALSPDKKT